MTTRTIHRVMAGAVLFSAVILYLATVSPTIAFWDSPEFVTTSRIMGIPHPPGSPLLSLAGRVMSLIPFYDFRGYGLEHIAYRINMLSVLLAAGTLLLTYLITTGLLWRIRPRTGMLRDDWPVIFSAATAALTAGMAHQFWENAVETETYMPSLFLSLLAFQLVLMWEERKENPRSPLYLMAAAYFVGLGLGVHLSVLLIAPSAVLLVFLTRPGLFTGGQVWVPAGAALAALLVLRMFANRGILYLAIAAGAVAGPYFVWRLYRSERVRARLPLWTILACLAVSFVGYTVYGTVAVRAMKDPAVNEGDPDTMQRFTDYLARKQYLEENMYTGMFGRKADPGYQFGFMFLRYLLQQTPDWGPSFGTTFTNDLSADYPGQTVDIAEEVRVSVLIWALIIAGIVIHLRRDPARFHPLMLFFLLSSVGLVIYLNMENPQVRERDYFFLGAFHVMWIWFGIGLAGALGGAEALLERRGLARFRMPVTVALALLAATVVPVSALSRHLDPPHTNYDVHDRSGNVIPYEYGRNILASCEENAVLFTHGDNDTYPVWYLQEVEGFRTDVRVVNLSLLNAPWYIKQLRDDPDNSLPIEYTDEFIDERLTGNTLASQRTRTWSAEPREVTVAGITWMMPPTYPYTMSDGSRIGVLSVAAIMTVHIIEQVNWSRPVYFAVTVNPDTMIGLDRFMAMEGMVFRLTKTPAEGRYHINTAVLDRNLFDRYSYTGVADPSVYKDAETAKLLRNYFIGFVDLTEQYLAGGRTDDAVRAADAAVIRCAPDLDRRILLMSILADGGARDAFQEMMAAEMARLPDGDFTAAVDLGSRLLQYEVAEGAIMLFDTLRTEYPRSEIAWKGYAAALYQAEDYAAALDALDTILDIVPDDPEALRLREIIGGELTGSPADSTSR